LEADCRPLVSAIPDLWVHGLDQEEVATVSRSYVTLAEHSTDMVRLACTKCERRGQYRKVTLIIV